MLNKYSFLALLKYIIDWLYGFFKKQQDIENDKYDTIDSDIQDYYDKIDAETKKNEKKPLNDRLNNLFNDK